MADPRTKRLRHGESRKEIRCWIDPDLYARFREHFPPGSFAWIMETSIIALLEMREGSPAVEDEVVAAVRAAVHTQRKRVKDGNLAAGTDSGLQSIERIG